MAIPFLAEFLGATLPSPLLLSRSPEAISCGLDESPDRQEALCILHTRVVDRERVSTENCGSRVAVCWDVSSC